MIYFHEDTSGTFPYGGNLCTGSLDCILLEYVIFMVRMLSATDRFSMEFKTNSNNVQHFQLQGEMTELY